VLPRQPAKSPTADGLAAVLQDARVPVWAPWPLPHGWLVTGFLTVGDDRSGADDTPTKTRPRIVNQQ